MKIKVFNLLVPACLLLALLLPGALAYHDPASARAVRARSHGQPENLNLAPTGGATIQAASCSQADVQAAIDAAADGDTVLVPAGSCTWTTTQAMTPAVSIANKTLTLQGAGIDRTTITDGTGYQAFEQALVLDSAAGKVIRLTGFTFQGGHDQEWHGIVNIWGSSTCCAGFRVDHVRFVDTINHTIEIGDAFGVIDHCTIEGNSGGILVKSTYPGDSSWAAPLELGSARAVYVEDCVFDFDAHYRGAIDAQSGGRYVFRHNTLINTYITNHGTETGYPERGAFSFEIYANTLSSSEDWFTAMFLRGGTGVIFDNTASGFGNLAVAANYRSCDPYGDWGRCDGTSAFDGNAEANGYPCFDQIGRSTDAGPGTAQALEPLYQWGNILDGLEADLTVHWGCPQVAEHIQENRDYFDNTPRPGYTPYTYPHPLTQELVLNGAAGNRTIALSWELNASLPLTSTWEIDYEGPPGDQPPPVAELPAATRAFTLTGLANYNMYTITLSALVASTPILSDTLRLMPSDLSVHIPLALTEP